ncbi:MAG TPA: hypothetical protein VFI27_11720 [candidate division Zixibacteria bacterium]|nr:hypothetical protein [candidate division Zixibacteria bacterium]
MTKKFIFLLILFMALLLGTTAALAGVQETGLPWQGHAAPFDKLFNNLIDNHQQTMLLPNGNLRGFIYIQFTGKETNGIPVAVRADCEDASLDCRVGWVVDGKPMQATLVQKSPRKWLVDEASVVKLDGYNHFQWDGLPKKPCGFNSEYTINVDGYLFKRTAVQEFYWQGGSDNPEHGGHLVTPGIDPHANIVTSWDDPGGGGSGGEGGCGGHDGDTDTGGGCGGHTDDGSDSGGGCDGHTDDGSDTDGGCGGHTDDGSDSGGDCGGH